MTANDAGPAERASPRRHIPVATAVLVVAASFVLAACAAAQPNSEKSPASGPLRYEDYGQIWCSDPAIYEEMAVGIPLDFAKGSPVRIQKITAVGAKNMRLVGAYSLPVDADLRVGTEQWPLAATWKPKSAVNAVGSTIGKAEHRDLILHVARTAANGTIADFKITYTQAGSEYTADTFTRVTIADDCEG